MLRIRKEVDLKELEKFGFSPRYDEYTGEKKLYKKTILRDYDNAILIVEVKVAKNWQDRLLHLKGDLNFENGKILMDFLYDLFQSGLVEKVEE